MGAGLIAISPQMEKYNDTIIKEKKLTFTIVSDAHNNIAEQLGIKFTLPEKLQGIYDSFKINLPHYNGDDSWTLPMPTRLIVDTSLTIRYIETDPDYTVRPEPLHTLEVLKDIVQGGRS
jgi:peroxiredoxin